VWINLAEQRELAELLNISVGELRSSYLERRPLVPKSHGDGNGDGDSSSSEEELYQWSVRQIRKSNNSPVEDYDASSSSSSSSSEIVASHVQSQQCIFLSSSSNTCSVYRARPTQCRTFPYWPSIMASEDDWKLAASKCEGIRLSTRQKGDASRNNTETSQLDDLNTQMRNDDAVHPETIWNYLLVHTVHRANMHENDNAAATVGGNDDNDDNDDDDDDDNDDSCDDDSSMTYAEMSSALSLMGEDMISEFRRDYVDYHRRKILYRSDNIVVIDTIGQGLSPAPHRSMMFVNSPDLVQTQMPIEQNASDGTWSVVTSSRDIGSVKNEDSTTMNNKNNVNAFLQLDIHRTMHQLFSSWLLQEKGNDPVVAILGTGGGSLVRALSQTMPSGSIECVEADEEVLHVAKSYFGLVDGSDDGDGKIRINSHCQLGEEYVDEQYQLLAKSSRDRTTRHKAGRTNNQKQRISATRTGEKAKYEHNQPALDALIIDVAAPSEPHGLVAIPPPAFLADDFVVKVKVLLSSRSSNKAGVVLWNVGNQQHATMDDGESHPDNSKTDHGNAEHLPQHIVDIKSKIARRFEHVYVQSTASNFVIIASDCSKLQDLMQ